MKEKNCKETHILDPNNNRCINKNTKKGIELLFNKGDKNILKLYELIDSKIVKKCDENKIRSPTTKKCIKKPALKETRMPKKKSVLKKSQMPEKESVLKKSQMPEKESVLKKSQMPKKEYKLANKIKNLLPFINRVSANIYHRNRYLVLMRRELNDIKEGCIRIYKENPDGSISYRIGNKIILKKRIGTDNDSAIVYLSEFRDKDKKHFTFASKVYNYKSMYQETYNELKLLAFLTNIVRQDLCPHFLMFYGNILCKSGNILHFENDSFVKSKSSDISIIQDIEKYPEVIKQHIKATFVTTFNELANGDLNAFFEDYINKNIYLANALIQQLLSIMFFNYYAKKIHTRTHPSNFLYHKIKAGGYFHYNLFGVDYYLENIGFLWVICDFYLSADADAFVYNYNRRLDRDDDYNKIIMAYFSNKKSKKERYLGYNKKNIKDILYEFVSKIYEFTTSSLYIKFDSKKKIDRNQIGTHNIKKLIINLPKTISETKLDGKYIFLTSLPKGATIINKDRPYTMEEKNLF